MLTCVWTGCPHTPLILDFNLTHVLQLERVSVATLVASGTLLTERPWEHVLDVTYSRVLKISIPVFLKGEAFA